MRTINCSSILLTTLFVSTLALTAVADDTAVETVSAGLPEQPAFVNATGDLRTLSVENERLANLVNLRRLSAIAQGPRVSDLPFLESTLKSLTKDEPGLGHPKVEVFRNNCREVCQKLRRLTVQSSEDFSKAFNEIIRSRDLKDPRNLASTNAAWNWIVDHGGKSGFPSSELSSAPDVYLWAAADMFGSLESTTSTDEAVKGQLRGVPYQGQAKTTRTSRIDVVQSKNQARLLLSVTGNSRIISVGRSQGVSVKSDAKFDFNASATLDLSDTGWSSNIGKVDGVFSSRPVSTSVSWNRVFKGLARRKALAEHRAGVGTAKKDAISQLRNDFSQELSSTVSSLNASRTETLNRLARLGHSVKSQEFQSRENQILASIRLTAASPITIDSRPIIQYKSGIQIHETAFNSLIASSFPDGIVKADELFDEISGSQTSNQNSTEPEEALELALPIRNPVTFAFRDGQIVATVHAQSIKTGIHSLGQTDVAVAFSTPCDSTLNRSGKVTLVNSSAYPEPPRSGFRALSTRRIIGNVISESFPTSISVESILGSAFDFVSEFDRSKLFVYADNGWLTIAID